MKNGIRIVLIILLIHTMMMRGNTSPPPAEQQADFPKKVSGILTNSCYDCHTTGSNAQKALSASDVKTICNWTKKESEKLIK